jgi:uncharacterized protein YjbI with pentapeptide repeats
MAEEPENEAGLREIPSSEILDKIKKGDQVTYDRVRIVGDMDLSKLELPTEHVDRTGLQKLADLKEDIKIVSSFIRIVNSTIQGALDFSNSTFSDIVLFRGTTFSDNVWFHGATFCGEANFEGTTFQKACRFSSAIFREDAIFHCATFGGAGFDGATFGKHAFFGGTTFNMAFFMATTFVADARFQGAIFGAAWFRGATFGSVWFYNATFDGQTIFEDATFAGSAIFNDAIFGEDARFSEAKFEGDVLTFRDAAFADAGDQEVACRKAKIVLERNGDREEAGYHFYREMEAKRKQKESSYRYIDYESLLFYNETSVTSNELKDPFKYLRYNILEYLFIQVIFGYGVHPRRLWGFWLGFAALFAILYWIGDGINNSPPNQPLNFLDHLWFSITVAVTPGFAGYKPTTGIYQVLAGLEAIFGTFMWAAFITTFARKYMR